MSTFNEYANTPEATETTRAWLRRDAPLVLIYGPSGKGKTHLAGSLFRHPLYHRVLLIDVDQGSTTIAQYSMNPQLCDRQVFDLVPEQRVGWFNKQLKYARTANCGAIIVEGFMSIHRGIVAKQLEDCADSEGPAVWEAHKNATTRTTPMIESLKAVKQYRIANRVGVPIIVTLNTREAPIPGVKDARKTVPDMSPNLIEKAMAASDAFLELRRDVHGVQLLTLATPDNDARKLRAPVPFGPKNPDQPNAAQLIQQQTNLDLPGMFALWAKAELTMQESITALYNPTISE